MFNPILHIPHSSTDIPILDGFTLSNAQIEEEVMLLTDWYTDELFEHEEVVTVKAGFSRVFCDVERFSDDSLEVMAKYGMGVLYTHTDDGRRLREVASDLRERILNKYYEPHHLLLENEVEASLRTTETALIIDCHSFPDAAFKRDLDQSPNRPDISIGTDDFHTSKKLLITTEKFFIEKGLTVGINKPYSGTIVPSRFHGKSRHVESIMIEVNRKLYLHEATNLKSDNFNFIQAVIGEYLDGLLGFS
jgi:N-formylglutamate deformylase